MKKITVALGQGGIWLALQALLLLCYPTKQVFALSCDVYMQTYRSLKEHSIYPLIYSDQWKSEVWEKYLNILDSENLYLKADEFAALLDEFKHQEVLPEEATCQQVERAGKQVAQRVLAVQAQHGDVLQDLKSRGWNLGENASITIPIAGDPRANSSADFYKKWQKYLAYKYFESGAASEQRFTSNLNHLFAMLADQAQQTYFYYVSFMEAVFSTVDPYSNFYFAYKLRKDEVADTYRFRSLRRLLPKQQQNPDGRTYINLASKLLGIYMDVSNYYQNHITIREYRPRVGKLHHSSYYEPQTGDYVVHIWGDKDENINQVLLLRKERDGLKWNHFSGIPAGFVSFRGTHHQKSLHHFFFYRTATGEELGDSWSAEARKRKAPSVVAPPQSATASLKRPLKRPIKSGVMYLSLRYLLPGKFSDEFIAKKLNSIMALSESYDWGKYKYRAILLDLRNSSLQYSLQRYLLLLDFLLPRTRMAVAAVQHRDKVRFYRTQSATTQYRGPLVLLVDRNTESYAELMAATLQEYGRALIVGAGLGTRTSGRSYIRQSIDDFMTQDLGGILDVPRRVMMAKRVVSGFLWTPAGRDLYGVGVKPDITLPHERDVSRGVSAYSGEHHSLPEVKSSLSKCYAPLSPALISFLKSRSDERLLAATYPRSELLGEGLVVRQLSFEEAFQRSALDLKEQKPSPSCEPRCSELSLAEANFTEQRRLSEGVNALYRREPKETLKRDFYAAAAEDSLLKEALNLALDYAYYVQEQAAVSSSTLAHSYADTD